MRVRAGERATAAACGVVLAAGAVYFALAGRWVPAGLAAGLAGAWLAEATSLWVGRAGGSLGRWRLRRRVGGVALANTAPQPCRWCGRATARTWSEAGTVVPACHACAGASG